MSSDVLPRPATKWFVVLFGPPAVGKMTVGQALASLTGLKLLHNHMTIELLLPIFPFGTPSFTQLNDEFRRRIIEEVAQSDLPGLIFTGVWDLASASDTAVIDGYCAFFRHEGGRVCFVELVAPLEVRLDRNRTANRIQHKPSKADIAQSEARLLHNEQRHKMNSADDFPYPEQYIKIANEHLSPMETAERIRAAFGLP
jgi:cytidylate kinase